MKVKKKPQLSSVYIRRPVRKPYILVHEELVTVEGFGVSKTHIDKTPKQFYSPTTAL